MGLYTEILIGIQSNRLARNCRQSADKLRALLLALLISGTISAGATEAWGASDPKFTSLCIEDQSTGFHWKDGKWIRAKFVPEKFIVEKLNLDNAEGIPAANVPAGCLGMPGTSEDGFHNGCYDIRNFGEEPNPYSGQVCRELWSDDGAGDELLQVICDGKITSMVFEPTGKFHYSKVHWLVSDDPESDERDSLVLSVGSCSEL